MEAEKQRCNKLKSTAQQKKTAMKLLNDKDYSKTEIAKKCNINRTTLYRWIEEKKEQVQTLTDSDLKIKLWQSSGLNHLRRAEVVAESLMEDLAEERLTPANKNSFMANSVIAAGTCWDKSRLEAGQSTSNISYAQMVRATEGKIIDVTPNKEDKE